MKNQYFGDVNDYRKYGLLRALQAEGQLRLSVGWMLTPDDGGTDGGFRRYLTLPGEWRCFDTPLFDGLVSMMESSHAPHVGMIESSGLLPSASFFSDIVPDALDAREEWAIGLVRSTSGADLVFLDPDNGLQVASKPAGRRGSSKYAMWSEFEALWNSGASVLVYQHFRREARDDFVARMMAELRDRTGAPLLQAFRTPHVLFLLAGQVRHRSVLERSVERHLPRWSGQIQLVNQTTSGL